MKLSACGRADLVRVLVARGPELLSVVARQLGYEPSLLVSAATPTEVTVAMASGSALATAWGSGVPAGEAEVRPQPLPDVPFWRLEQVEYLPPATPEPPETAEPAEVDAITLAHWRGQPAEAPDYPPLNAWPSLLRRLREVMAERAEQRAVDVAEVIAQLSRGQFLARLPRQRRRRWGAGLQIIQDRSQRLVPYWRDQDRVYEGLRRLYPRHGLELARVHEGVPEPVYADRNRGRYRPPPSSARVLVLGDLGCLDRGGASRAFWAAMGRRIRGDGKQPVALLPCPPERWAADIQAEWGLIAWDRASAPAPRGERADIDGRARRLLRLVSPAVRIEPGFLRAVRLILGAEADAATESDAWQHPAITSMSSVAASLDPTEIASLRREFEEEPEALRAAALKLLRLWRAGVSAEVWFEELIGLDPGSRALLAEPRDLDDAERYFERLEGELRRGAAPGERAAGARRWFRRVRNRLPDASAAWRGQRLGQSLRRLWELTHEGGRPPPGFDPSEIPAAPALAEERWRLDQCGAEVRVSLAHRASVDEPARPGSALCTVRSRNGLIRLSPEGRGDFWQSGVAPGWAVEWGKDDLGVFAVFEYRGVRQRLRWIASGRFRMGSPDHEAGRGKDEGPQHAVTLSRGFWLFDTPCTQALWEALIVDNPSRFRSADRPVEGVTWEDVQGFLAILNGAVPDLALTLPTEAQWEHACRAGKGTATYAGDLEIRGVNDAPLLDALGWYAGNSGVGFDLDDGYDSSDWAEKQYEHKLAGTHPVARKAPNAWGLYDMLGNVYEWCLDGPRRYQKGAVRDPIGPTEWRAARVFRGGSWDSDAGRVRCASRDWHGRGRHGGNLGFRCARAQPGAEPAGTEQGRVAEHRPARDPSGGVMVVRVQPSPGAASDVARVAVPEPAGFLIATDCERLRFRSITRPSWASAIGRDRSGLWVEFEVPGKKGEAVSQRMRWVPPGRFWMGSPEREAGRYDDEGPCHEVTLSGGFWLGDTACTQALWEAVMGKNPSRFKGGERPVEQVSFKDVQRFLERLNRLVPGSALTLPSEAEWEYACRAGTETPFSLGEDITAEEVNYDDNHPYAGGRTGRYRRETVAVGSLPPNPWGFYEMHGNVWEWCLDGKRDYQAVAVQDPVGPTEPGAARVMRGGGWDSGARYARCAYRGWFVHRDDDVGFRCARAQQGP